MMTDERLAEIRKYCDKGELLFPSSVKELLTEIDRLRAENSELRSGNVPVGNNILPPEELTQIFYEVRAERDKLREKLRWLIGVAEEWVPFEKHYGPWAEAKALVEGK
jgi:hypothetical protein